MLSITRGAAGARSIFVAAVLVAVLALALPGIANADSTRELDVMTQNLYLGSSLDQALQAQTQTEFLIAATTIWGTVQFTNFPVRSDAIANEILAEQPDLIGLQEVTQWTTSGASAFPSLDFLAILQQDLVDRGLNYSVASVSNNANVGPVPLLDFCTAGPLTCQVSLLDRDVILVNNDNPRLVIRRAQSGNYRAQQVLNTPVGPLSFNRGWNTVDGLFVNKKFRLANTHLEVEGFAAAQEAQGREFLRGPARTSGAVIATGDFNSAADGSTTTTYSDLTRSYFTDAWNVNPGDPGLTCCQNSTLSNPTSELSSRIDLVLTHDGSRALSADVIGDTPFQGVPPFWPSDHAGVVAGIRLH
jgi:endonuclease/exonuclease/phosphatase family metal-dependent hydrolase